MYAWKCDICGGLYEDADVETPESRVDPFTGVELTFYRRGFFTLGPKKKEQYSLCIKFNSETYVRSTPEIHDVCPDCMKKIEDLCRSIRTEKEMERNG